MLKRNLLYLFIFVIFTGIFVAGCKKEPTPLSFYEQYKIDSVIIQNYITENQLEAFDVEYNSQATGVYCVILEEGTEETDLSPGISSDVTVKYRGYLVNGSVFDQTEEGDSLSFNLGGTISGWRIGFTALSKGDKARLIIPSFYGYGTVSKKNIPANSVLLFDVELLNFSN
jgi:FKBP-type peptidyl-prolyl cis-trans isomerase FkpA